MKQATIQITFEEEKLRALRRYIAKRDSTLETELQKAAQPSAYPPSARKPDVAPMCGNVAGTASAEEDRLWALFGGGRSRKRQGRTKPRCRVRPAAVTSARGAGSFEFSRRGC